ncbi:hypothetical protein KKG45_12385 [bacterium]|nr:hypothetical protein [bacterium]MBU1074035.1 hypothetical protein [bacterium]MBU1674704.1 hypothetical protein [bacterium]
MSDSTDRTQHSRRTFSGSYERAVDPKGRFNLPFQYRRGDSAECDDYVVTLGVDGNLSIYPTDIWDVVFQTAKTNARTAKEQAIIRHVSANTFDIIPDKQGRVMVPVHMFENVGIDKRVLVVGMGDHLELWDTDVYTAHQKRNMQLDTDFLREFFS